MKTACPTCGCSYKRCGTHWSKSDCKIPRLSDYQKELLVGLLMGDGWVRTTETADNPMFAMEMKEERYIRWAADKLRPFTTKVVTRNREDVEGVTDETYVVRMSSHPWLETLYGWYESGKKVFPDSIELTPVVLSAWYVCDGTCKGKQAVIYSGNEYRNVEKIERMFERAGLSTPIDISGCVDESGYSHGRIAFSVEDSKAIFEYMGSPPPGFEYKWPSEAGGCE